MKLIENLKWRYATKKFDPSKKVSAENLEKIKKAVQLSASSYGLQLYKMLIIEAPKLRARLKSASWGQDQITDASYLIVFCSYSEIEDHHVDEYLKLTAETRQVELDKLEGYGNFMKQKIAKKSSIEMENWTSRQTYLALGNLLAACAELKIDACPIEGFEPKKYDEILGLKEQGLTASVIATIGYRAKDDHAQFEKKVRKPKHRLFEMI